MHILSKMKMSNKRKSGISIKLGASVLLIVLTQIISAQESESTNVKTNIFSGVVTVQSKGISTIPNLTLGKPAVLFDMKVGRKLTFEPQFRFSLEGKPWAVVFWWRYTPTLGEKFSLNFSANHSFSFKEIDVFTLSSIGTSQEIIRTTRYLAGAVTPNYKFNKYVGVGMYLFYAHGIEEFITQNTWMVSLRPTVSNIPITKNIVAGVNPDIYYLKMDGNDGFYLTTRFSISKNGFPISVSALINKPLESDIPSNYDFLWNVGISYSFSDRYTEIR